MHNDAPDKERPRARVLAQDGDIVQHGDLLFVIWTSPVRPRRSPSLQKAGRVMRRIRGACPV